MPGATIETIDGKTRLTISQSWLNTYADCPEAARHQLLRTYPEHDAPEAYFGTVMHAAYDMVIRDEGDPIALLTETFTDYELPRDRKGERHKWDTTDSKTANWTMVDLALDALQAWLDLFWVGGETLKDRGPGLPEMKFERLVYSDASIEVWLIGQIDYHFEGGLEIWDWKNSARKWDQWEVDRYDLQSTAYGIGLHGVTLPGELSFNFGVVNPDNFSKSKKVSVTRDQRHVDSLIEDTIAPLARLLARQPLSEPWPALSQSWKCSPKWCAHFGSCRGRHGLDW